MLTPHTIDPPILLDTRILQRYICLDIPTPQVNPIPACKTIYLIRLLRYGPRSAVASQIGFSTSALSGANYSLACVARRVIPAGPQSVQMTTSGAVHRFTITNIFLPPNLVNAATGLLPPLLSSEPLVEQGQDLGDVELDIFEIEGLLVVLLHFEQIIELEVEFEQPSIAAWQWSTDA